MYSCADGTGATRDKLRAAAEARAAAAAGDGGGQSGAQPQRGVRQTEGNEAFTDEEEEDEVLAEHFTRNTQFFGRDGQRRVAGSFVVVIGLGVRAGP